MNNSTQKLEKIKCCKNFLFSISLIVLVFVGVQGCNKNNLTTPPPVTFPITGTVFDSTTHIPIPFATVQLGSHATTTSSAGTYSFSYSQIRSVSDTIKVVANGYQPASKQIQVISDTTQMVDFSIPAFQETISLNNAIDANSYSSQKFSIGSYPFVQCSNGTMSHDVKVIIHIDTATYPVHLIVVSPDGSYKLEQTVPDTGFTQAFMTNSCDNWAVVVYDSETTQAAYSGTITMDFSNYPISSDSVLTNIMVPFNYPAIAPNTDVTFTRFLEANMSYQLRMNISGGSSNDINLITYTELDTLFNQRVSGGYVSESFVATEDDFYNFEFSNKSVASSKLVSGVLVITH